MAQLQALAQQLQPLLRTSGPAPQLTHIMAAILIARDSMPARAACRAVVGVPENVHGRINKLASRVAPLLAGDGLPPNVPPLPPPAPPPAPSPEQLANAQTLDSDVDVLGLPSLQATLEPPIQPLQPLQAMLETASPSSSSPEQSPPPPSIPMPPAPPPPMPPPMPIDQASPAVPTHADADVCPPLVTCMSVCLRVPDSYIHIHAHAHAHVHVHHVIVMNLQHKLVHTYKQSKAKQWAVGIRCQRGCYLKYFTV